MSETVIQAGPILLDDGSARRVAKVGDLVSVDLDYPPLSPPTTVRFTCAVEEWQRERQTPEWAYRAAYVANHWCVGLPLPASEYDAAIHAAQHGEIRLWPSRTFPTSP